MSLVVDASALLFAVTDPSARARSLLERLGSEATHAPHLIDAEVGSAVRRKVLREEMDPDRARSVLSLYPVLIDYRYEHHGLLAAMAWELRDNLSFYDALYVALAGALDLDVLTLDEGMADAPGLPVNVTVVP